MCDVYEQCLDTLARAHLVGSYVELEVAILRPYLELDVGPSFICAHLHTQESRIFRILEKYLNRKSRPAHGGLLAEGEGSVEGGGVGAPVVAAVVGAGHLVLQAGVGAGVAVPPLPRPHLR